MNLDTDLMDQIFAHAEKDYPRECCGLMVVISGVLRYMACANTAEKNEHFVIAPEEYARIEDMGEVTAVVHSHCNELATPSQADLVGCEKSQLPWIIVAWPTKDVQQIEPTGYQAPLIGRNFLYGVLDCFTLIQDYYRINLGIIIPGESGPNEWWLKGQKIYVEGYADRGFVRVHESQLKLHDIVLMQVASPTPNHAAVYIGDNMILHHVMDRLSSRDIYGGWWQKITTHHLRHKDLMT